MKARHIFYMVGAALILIQCGKGGTGGKNTINAMVLHHEAAIVNAKVYLKYDAKDFPGEDISLYDEIDSTGSDNEVIFNELKKGNYYLYSVGFDPAISKTVTGGIPWKITSKSGTHQVKVQVTEDGH